MLETTLNQMRRIFDILSSDPSKLDQAMEETLAIVQGDNRTARDVLATSSPLSDRETNVAVLSSIPVAHALEGRNGFVPPSASLLTGLIAESFSRCQCGGMLSLRSPTSVNSLLTAVRRSRGRSRLRRRQPQGIVQPDPANRYLLCENHASHTCPILQLPKRGQIEPHRFQCPACRYQVATIYIYYISSGGVPIDSTDR